MQACIGQVITANFCSNNVTYSEHKRQCINVTQVTNDAVRYFSLVHSTAWLSLISAIRPVGDVLLWFLDTQSWLVDAFQHLNQSHTNAWIISKPESSITLRFPWNSAAPACFLIWRHAVEMSSYLLFNVFYLCHRNVIYFNEFWFPHSKVHGIHSWKWSHEKMA